MLIRSTLVIKVLDIQRRIHFIHNACEIDPELMILLGQVIT